MVGCVIMVVIDPYIRTISPTLIKVLAVPQTLVERLDLSIHFSIWSVILSTLQVIQSALVSVWGMRLGIFLILRMWRDGHDNRFNHVKGNPIMFFAFWTVEGRR